MRNLLSLLVESQPHKLYFPLKQLSLFDVFPHDGAQLFFYAFIRVRKYYYKDKQKPEEDSRYERPIYGWLVEESPVYEPEPYYANKNSNNEQHLLKQACLHQFFV